MKFKKSAFDQLGGLVIGLVVVGVVMAVGFLIMSNVRTQVAAQEGVYVNNGSSISGGVMISSAWNGTTTSMNALGTLPGWLPIIVIVVIGSLLIGLVLAFRQKQG